MYLDTSALAALYVPEPLSGAAAKAAVGPLSLSSLTRVEFASMVARRLRERSLAPADGARVLRALDGHLAERRFRLHAVGNETFAEAERMLRSGSTALAALDALHLAVAALAKESILTADRQLARAASRFGVRALLLRA